MLVDWRQARCAILNHGDIKKIGAFLGEQAVQAN